MGDVAKCGGATAPRVWLLPWCHRHVGVYNALEDEPTGKAKNGNNTLKDVKMLCAAKRN